MKKPNSANARALDAPLASLRGVGPARELLLERLGLETLQDLLFHVPRRLEHSGTACTLAEASTAASQDVLIFHGRVAKRRFQRFGRRSTLRLTIRNEDDSADEGPSLEIVYFNQPWQRERFEKGAVYTFAGCVASSDKGPVVVAPRFDDGASSLIPERWFPIYATTEGLGNTLLSSWVQLALERCAHELHEALPNELLRQLQLLPLPDAVRELHQPASPTSFESARRRILFETLLGIQARVLQRTRAGRQVGAALRIPTDAAQSTRILNALPFELTGGQRTILSELERDLARSLPMRRLLQGDVGAGKTVLGLFACASVCAAGAQSAFMAPTELLAEQHYFGLRDWLARLGVRAELLTGSMPTSLRKPLLARLMKGEIDVLFGTHALFSKSVRFARLALAVIDEQQRFGVAQRGHLLEKGEDVHLLLMTATPIPRTLALTIYGDLDVSVLREKPAGRGEIRTRWLRPKDGERLPEFLKERLAAGEQVYWVAPRIGEEGETGATRTFERLTASDMADFGIELVHGRQSSEERATRLERFRRGEARLLVATTVIEVGVDVPRATVMVIEEAERLGLAQLHQLRGRVGRGAADSWCLLFGKAAAKERFQLLEQCNDGFELAEADLQSRGMGELAGQRQSGEFGGLFASLNGDLDLLTAARDLLQSDARLCVHLAGEPSASQVVP